MDEVEADIVSCLCWVLTKCNSITAVNGGSTSRATVDSAAPIIYSNESWRH